MNPQEIKSVLESLLATLLPATPIDWPNTDFTQPSTDFISSDGVSWARPAFRPGNAIEADFDTDERLGVFIIQLFFPKGTGSGDALAKASTIEEAYKRKDFNSLHCKATYTNEVGEWAGESIADGGRERLGLDNWYQVNVIIPWFDWPED